MATGKASLATGRTILMATDAGTQTFRKYERLEEARAKRGGSSTKKTSEMARGRP